MTKKQKGTDLIWGIHAVRAALRNPLRTVENIFVTQEGIAQRLNQEIGGSCTRVSVQELEKYIPEGGVHQGVVAFFSPLAPLPLEHLYPEKGLVLALDEVVDPHNVGALWRSAAAFGAQGLILTKHNSPCLDGTVSKSACGAMDYVPYVRVTNLVHTLIDLKKRGFFIAGLQEKGAMSLHQCDLWPLVLVVGAEGKGLRRLTQEHCDQLLFIECGPHFQTLNASVAGAIALQHFYHIKSNHSV